MHANESDQRQIGKIYDAMAWSLIIVSHASIFDSSILLSLYFSADSADKRDCFPSRAFGSDDIYWAECDSQESVLAHTHTDPGFIELIIEAEIPWLFCGNGVFHTRVGGYSIIFCSTGSRLPLRLHCSECIASHTISELLWQSLFSTVKHSLD